MGNETPSHHFLGLTAIGNTTALHRVIDARAFDSAQVVYNMLNPSAATELPSNYPAQDYGRLFDHTTAADVGAGGALSGERHPIASPPPEPIGSARATTLMWHAPSACYPW
jgi:hypothetical protein